eukprot:TRINITY_DN38850_c0_g1_i1.p1 TRINITY_DN38850_c0_g1~~TRINITY_DN38850_c0_g1_i1.p1  ORF type:complete len:121 (+),score=29.30 TRINITY_DN38850_c0_g1_i1:133-495(+)
MCIRDRSQSVDKYWTDEVIAEMADISQNVNAIETIEPLITTLEGILQPLSSTFPLFGLLVRAFHNKVISTWHWLSDPSSHMEAHTLVPVSYTHLRAHETPEHLVCRLLLEKKKQTKIQDQ